MNIKRALIAGVVAAIINYIYNIITCGWLFSWIYQLPPTEIWRPMAEVSLLGLALAGILSMFVFVFVFALLYKGIPGTRNWEKGLTYGFLMWAVGGIAGLVICYLFMNVAAEVIVYWIFRGLVLYLIVGLITAWIYKE